MNIIRIINSEKIPLIIAALIYVSTIGLVSPHILIFVMLLICLAQKRLINKAINKDKTSFEILLIIVFLSLFNEIIGVFAQHVGDVGVIEIIPYSVFIVLTILAAKVTDERVMKWLVIITIIEICVAVAQRFLGINSFYAVSEREIIDTDILYDLKVNGLHNNSSGLGYNAFLLIILYEYFPVSRVVKRYWIYMFAIVGIVLSFNRTAMIGLLTFGILSSFKNKKLLLLYTIILVFVIHFGAVEFLVEQMTRGTSELSGNALSGRDAVFPWYWGFFTTHLLEGNHSFKLYLTIDGLQFHAHNAYLQTLATNGLVISMLYFWIIFRKIDKLNYRFVIPILACGLFQSFFLWGASYNDFVLWGVLFGNIHETSNLQRNTSAHRQNLMLVR